MQAVNEFDLLCLYYHYIIQFYMRSALANRETRRLNEPVVDLLRFIEYMLGIYMYRDRQQMLWGSGIPGLFMLCASSGQRSATPRMLPIWKRATGWTTPERVCGRGGSIGVSLARGVVVVLLLVSAEEG